jgi:hypothetical protein
MVREIWSCSLCQPIKMDLSFKNLIPRQSGWMPYTRSPDFMGVKGEVLDPRVLMWIGQSPECFQFRVDTIKWIQDQLEDPVKAISNGTIGSIMTFAMWTVCSTLQIKSTSEFGGS